MMKVEGEDREVEMVQKHNFGVSYLSVYNVTIATYMIVLPKWKNAKMLNFDQTFRLGSPVLPTIITNQSRIFHKRVNLQYKLLYEISSCPLHAVVPVGQKTTDIPHFWPNFQLSWLTVE